MKVSSWLVVVPHTFWACVGLRFFGVNRAFRYRFKRVPNPGGQGRHTKMCDSRSQHRRNRVDPDRVRSGNSGSSLDL